MNKSLMSKSFLILSLKRVEFLNYDIEGYNLLSTRQKYFLIFNEEFRDLYALRLLANELYGTLNEGKVYYRKDNYFFKLELERIKQELVKKLLPARVLLNNVVRPFCVKENKKLFFYAVKGLDIIFEARHVGHVRTLS